MTDLHTVLPQFSTTPYSHLLPNLEKNRITTTDLLTIDGIEIAKRAQLPLLDVKGLAAHILATLRAELGFRPAENEGVPARKFEDVPVEGSQGWGRLKQDGVMLLSKPFVQLKTGDEALDAILGGGIPTGYITEFVGESGTGKTQILLHLLLCAQLVLESGGLGRASMYISTEHPLPTTRLSQMLVNNPTFSELPSSERPDLAKILSIQTPDLESQDHIIQYQLPIALERHNVGLVVIDSIAANYRAEEGPGKHAAVLASRSAHLLRTGTLLQSLARDHDCAIIVANQVGDRFEPVQTSMTTAVPMSTPRSQIYSSSPAPILGFPSPGLNTVGAIAPPVLSLDHQQRFFTGWGASPPLPSPSTNGNAHPTNQNLKTPSLGLTWANQIACRVALIKSPIMSQVSKDGRQWTRRMKMVFAPWVVPPAKGEAVVEYEIWKGGVRSRSVDVKVELHTDTDGKSEDVIDTATRKVEE